MRQFTPWRPQPCGPGGWWSIVLLLAFGLIAGEAFAQGHDSGSSKGGKGKVPPMGRPGMQKPGTKAAPKNTPAPQMPADLDPEKLPDGYTPPPATPELMQLDQPLLEEAVLTEYRKKFLGKYREKLRKGEFATKEDKDLIDKGLKYRLYVMTLKSNERDLHKLRENLTIADLRTAGAILTKQDQQEAFRKYVLQEIVKLAEPLLQNSFYVRLQAATLLGELELIPADPNKNIKLITYTPACEPLIKVLDDPQQPLPVKIAAARSLVRLCKFSGVNLPPVEQRHRIAKSVIAELSKPDTHYWYQVRLIEVLSTLDVALDLQTRKPFVVTALQSILNDPQRDWHARAEAAWALGRVPLDPAVEVNVVMRDVMQFFHDLAKATQQSPNDPKWKTCLFKVYLAFQPLNAEDREATRRTRAGLLNSPLTSAQALAQQTYPLVHPVVNAVLNDKPIVAKQIQDVADWLAKNKPANAAQVNAANPATQGP